MSKTNSGAWSGEDESDTSSDEYYSPPTAPLRRFLSVPPPQPLPARGTTTLRPPPPWHAPVGPVSVRPRIQRHSDAVSTSSESESEDSDGATRSLSRDGGRRQELLERLESKIRANRQLRSRMAVKRKELRELRRRKDNVDNAFMQTIRPHLTSKSRVAHVPIDVMVEKFRQMQQVRDEYYTAESAYEAMEPELDNAEFELGMLEAELSRVPRGRLGMAPRLPFATAPQKMEGDGGIGDRNNAGKAAHDAEHSAPPSPVTLLGISGDLPEDIHPLYQELLEAAGDRQLADEHVEDLEMHREKILYDLEIELHRKRVRDNQGNLIREEELRAMRSSLTETLPDAGEFESRFGITVGEDDLEFLRDYDLVSKRARKELEEASRRLTHLRDLCLRKGVMRKNPSYHEELAIFSGSPDWVPPPSDGNMALDPPPRTPGATPSLAHPRFPILLSNPSHVLALRSPLQALEQALRLPKDDPGGAQRRAECMKELGISTLMKGADNTPDYINQWLIHRLRTSPLEAELLLAVCESAFRVVNLRRWQEEVLYYWRLDDAARVEVARFEAGPWTPPREGDDEGVRLGGLGLGIRLGFDRDSRDYKLNSVIEGEGRVRSEDAPEGVGGGGGGGGAVPGRSAAARSVRSMG